MTPSTLTLGLLIAALISLAPLAHASPPDPLWIGGLFDANDQDDVVAVAASADGVTVLEARDAITAPLMALGAVPPPGSVIALRSLRPSFQGRAPPNV